MEYNEMNDVILSIRQMETAWNKPTNPAYLTEINKLARWLDENGYEYSVSRRADGYQLICEDWDVICFTGSYGYNTNKLEAYGSIVNEAEDGDTVVGWLTAEDVIERLERA